MEIDTPASPDAVPPPASPTDETPRIVQGDAAVPTISAGERNEYAELDTRPFRGYNSAEFMTNYTKTARIHEAFMRISSLGDVNSIYRNRPIWISYSEKDLVDVATQLVTHIPSTRTSILTYLGLLVHENANMFFSERENPKFAVNYSTVQSAALSLFDYVRNMIEAAPGEKLYLDVLKWCCDLSYELSENNNGRPLTGNCRTPETLLELFLTCPSIAEMISLMDFTISQLLIHCPEECMSALFYASRHGSHFNWIWLHIADTFPGKVVENIFTIGGEQFKAYVDTIQAKKSAQVAPHILDGIHKEYNIRFVSLSAVFNFLMRRGNIELRSIVSRMIEESLESDPKEYSNWNIVFFFKLVTVSVDTLRFLVAQNAHLATPLNFYRGMRQILSLDQEMILPRMSYPEFCHQMIHALDAQSQGVVFKVLMRIALDPAVFAGFENKDTGIVRIIQDGARAGVEDLLSIMLRVAHATDVLSPMDQSAIATFAAGAELQFVIDTAFSNHNLAPLVIRYLHLVSIGFTELKAAEIAARILFSCTEWKLMHVFCGFLSSIVPFYPDMMEIMYKNLFSYRSMYLEEDGVREDSEEKRAERDIVFITNIRRIFDWDVHDYNHPFVKNYSLNPRAHLGNVATNVLSICVETATKELQANRPKHVHAICIEVSKLLRVMSPPIPSQKVGQPRTVLLQNRYVYKIAIQLAYLQKIALCAICKEDTVALTVFEELRASAVRFYNDFCHQLQRYGLHLYFHSFMTHCMMENEAIFGEQADLDPWKENVPESKNNVDEDNYSFLDAVEKLDIRQAVNRLAHSGIIGKGAKRLTPPKVATDDQLIRVHAFLEAVRAFCTADTAQNNQIMTKQLCVFLVEILCQDGAAADTMFQDWDLEKENIFKYPVIQRIEASLLCRAMLDIVTETPPCTWYCLALVKHQLASILMKFMSTTDKNSRPTPQLLSLVDKWIIYARKGNLIPERFEWFIDILPHATVHEGFLLLHDIWRYFQRRSVTSNSVDHAIRSGMIASLNPDEFEGEYHTCRLVIQRHIAKIGYLFPKIFAAEVQALAR